MENLLNKNVSKEFGMKKGQSLAGALIVFAISVLIAMSLLPSINTAISDAALTGASAALASILVVVFVIILVFAGLRLAGLV